MNIREKDPDRKQQEQQKKKKKKNKKKKLILFFWHVRIDFQTTMGEESLNSFMTE